MYTIAHLATVCCLLMFFEIDVNSAITQSQTTDNVDYVYTELNSRESPISIIRVDILNNDKERRGVDNTTTKWSHKIPLVFDSTYQVHKASTIHTLRRSIQRIMQHVCVTYIDVTDTWDSSNSHWFTQNGYDIDAYVMIRAASGCSSASGYGNGVGPQHTSPCYDMQINTHEMFHTLKGGHTHQTPRRDSYITINYDDITPSLVFSYKKFTSPNFIDIAFDPMSALMYSDMTWTRNGLQTYTAIRDDFLKEGLHKNSDEVIFYEMSQLYRCNELFCGNSNTDCGPGYHTLIKGVCRCVCPSEFDPETNCKTLINNSSNIAKWPNTPMVTIAAGKDIKCPAEFDQTLGWLSFDGTSKTLQKPLPVLLPFHDKTIYIPLCTKSTPHNTSAVDWESWPTGGNLCMIKPLGVNCSGDFNETIITYKSYATVHHNGSIGDTTVHGHNTTMKMCCRSNQAYRLGLELPNKEPFRVLSTGFCPRIFGMREYGALLDLYTNTSEVSGESHPQYAIFSKELQLHECYFLPPVYGCNQVITLNKQTRSVTVTTPGFGVAREPNKRCIYSFQVPKNSQVRITFNKYDVHTDDYLLLKRYHKWQEQLRMDNAHWPEQFVSEGDYLSMEYWSSWESSTKKGINFTADVLLPEEACYNVITKGDDYFGNTTVSETYEDCLPWADTVDCHDFPTEGLNPIWLLLSGKSCRNPGGDLIQPWCYVYKNGTNCHKRYCDVCNTMSPIDVLKNCASLKTAQSDFCSTGIERHGCFKTCGFHQDLTPRSTCGHPNIPSNGQIVGSIKSSYKQGEKVSVKCAYSKFGTTVKEMVCTHSGWTHLESACQECPSHWVQDGDRCFNISSNTLTIRDAEKFCNAQGQNGTLFQIRNLRDQQFLRDYRQGLSGEHTKTEWISGEYRSDSGKWYFTNTDIEMTYFNWSDKYVPDTSDIDHNCVRLIADSYSDKGGWHPVTCNSSSGHYKYICQISSQDEPCGDRLSTSTCEQLLTVYPSFCSKSRTKVLASEHCRKSCGVCKLEPGSVGYQNASCKANVSSTLQRISSSDVVSPGHVMTFACKSGFYLHSGNLIRTCSSSGHLLGQDPICQAGSIGQDVKLGAVIRRHSTLPKDTAVLMINAGYRVPVDGKITKWYYFCEKAGLVSFLVYRPIQHSSNFSYIASNNVTCEPDRVRTYYVPAAHQITVHKDDAVGVFSTVSSTVSLTSCEKYTDKISNVVEITASSLADLPKHHWSPATACVVASIGYQIVPN